jgi:hypothetical protein
MIGYGERLTELVDIREHGIEDLIADASARR